MNNKYDINKLFDFFEYWRKFTHPTEFYNEGWLLKVLVLAVTDFGLKEHPLYVNVEDKFFSEGLMYSPFLLRFKKDPLSESHTHADGLIGNFVIGNDTAKGSVHLIGDKLNIFEAKINSGFSAKVTNAPSYNQAARYVACIVELLDKARKLENLDNLSIAFYLTVTKDQYKKDQNFAKFLDKEHIKNTVKKRVDQYEKEDDYNERSEWFDTKFTSVLEKIKIEPIFYEDIISKLEEYEYINEIKSFYQLCLNNNK